MIHLEPDEGVPPSDVLPLVATLPDLTVGWHLWTLQDDLLTSPGGAVWPHRRPRVASCPVAPHVAPAAGCACGVAVHSEGALSLRVATRWNTRSVVGCAATWGRGEGDPTLGATWRAKRGYPLFLVCDHHVPDAERRALAQGYGVPVYRVDAGTEVGTLFADRGRRVLLRTVRSELVGTLARRTRDEGGAGSPRAVEDIVESVVSTWSTAAAWRREHRPPTAPTAPTATPPRSPVAARSSPASPASPDRPAAVPDVPGIVVAWRSWNLRQHGLTSVTRSDPWPPRRPMVATCAHAGHRGPRQSCSCGIYSARSITHAGGYHALGGQESVLGCVALWGDLVEGTLGYRAEKATPLVLFATDAVPERVRTRVAERYGVPVHRVPGSSEWWSGATVSVAAEALRSALESSHGRLGGEVVRSAIERVVAAGAVSATGPPPIVGYPAVPALPYPPLAVPGPRRTTSTGLGATSPPPRRRRLRLPLLLVVLAVLAVPAVLAMTGLR